MMILPPLRLRRSFVTATLALSAALVIGCGEKAPSPAPTTAPAPSPASPTAKASKSAPGKGVDPTANMERDELRAYRKKMKEQGKAN